MAGTGIVAPSKVSPRFDDVKDVLYWFEGDSFDIEWILELVDTETGEAHPYQPTDKLYFNFFDAKKQLKQSFTFTDIQHSTVMTSFTPEISKKFVAGVYTYCIKYEWLDDSEETRIQTIIDNKKIKVEACH